LARKKGASGEGEMLTQVDWSRTRAYGLGLNGLYLNLQGRERNGIVRPGAEAEALSQELAGKLLALHDPKTGLPPITRISKPAEVYRGPYMQQAPDLVIGYNRGYRAGWGTVLGGVPAAVLEDNTEAWSGDHCMDYALVPGVLLSNKQVRLAAPSLTDVAPTILAELGVQKPQEMIGGSVFEPASRTGR
jgi:predicted AlkP superfamily phosphohydrolase/phosphomutase